MMYDLIMLISAIATIASFFLMLRPTPDGKTRTNTINHRGHSTFKKYRDRVVTKRPDLIFLGPLSFLSSLIFGGFSILVITSFVLLYRTFRTRWDWFPAFLVVVSSGVLGWYIYANQTAIERMLSS